MPISKLIAAALSAGMLFAVADAASGAKAKRPTFDEAWALCKAKLDARIPSDQAAQRHSAGASCMKRFGYRL